MYVSFEITGELPQPSRNLDRLSDKAIIEHIRSHFMPEELKQGLERAIGQVDVVCDWYHSTAGETHEAIAKSSAFVTAALAEFVNPGISWVQTQSGQFRHSPRSPRTIVTVSFKERT